MEQPVIFNWSSGKDAAMAMHNLMQDQNYVIGHLLTTVNEHFERVTMHGLRISVLDKQIRSLGIAATKVFMPLEPSMEVYESRMRKSYAELHKKGFRFSAYGDIFLEDLRQYRESEMASVGMKALFPIWNMNTTELIRAFINGGFKAIIVAINGEVLDESFAGREIDEGFLKDLPKNVDPCGENGEFHTFCYDGPIFKTPVDFKMGKKTYREYDTPGKNGHKTGYWFQDIL